MDRNQRDVQWLGEEEAHLGPAARAALGILIEMDDWAWWEEPLKTQASLERAAAGQGPVKWGGDSSVMDADQWVDSQRAVILGRAFYQLNRQAPQKIKVMRAVWGWPDGAQIIGQVALELSQLVGPGHVFPEWERNAKPRFPDVTRSQRGLSVVASPDLLPYQLLDAVQGYVEWSPDNRIADIVVAASAQALGTTRAARLVILYGQSVEDELAHVSSLRDDLSAQCVVHVEASEESISNWLKAMLTSWAEWGETFTDAIEMAAIGTGLRTLVLSSTQSFLFGRGTFSGLTTTVEARQSSHEYRLVPLKESLPPRASVLPLPDSVLADQVSSDDSEPSPIIEKTPSPRAGAASRDTDYLGQETGAARQYRPTPRVVRPAPPVERVLNAQARQYQQEIEEWPTHGVVEIDVDIRVKTPLRDRGDRPSFPDDRVEWGTQRKQLQVHMFEFGREPMSQTLDLSRTGDSTTATFVRESGNGPVDLRFLVSEGARILQTARLQTAPGETIRFFIENIVTSVHRAKTAFDAALLINDSLGSQPSATIIDEGGEAHFCPLTLSGIADARNDLLRTLERAVANPNAPLSPLMVELANSGVLLQNHIRSIVPAWPGNEARVQLVTQSDVFFPIEYLYDGKIPGSPDAVLCTESAGCLKEGKAITGCHIREAGEQLCPMGFLGISGVVERHTWKAGQDPRLWGAPGDHKSKRHRIDDLSTIAFAASDKADDFRDSDTKHHEVVRVANIEKALGVRKISDWTSWQAGLEMDSPLMLLLLVHLEKKAMYVGENVGLNLGAIGVQHVGNAPVVIAIGCSTGVGDLPGSSLPLVLQTKGARVVVAAMTGVLGRHANRVARDLAILLQKAAASHRSAFVGEVISAMRRQLLAEGLALGMAVVAFGDADIVLGRE
ncbi:hypothetical protein [Pseudomonas viridiflava]|uniref:hypothetical protein n=1 Tax=Pseudomonas viridiflava TaxID=33069 RepID=UPI002EB65DA7|nr:hypothetical protein [Pseudomonas viridiflava]